MDVANAKNVTVTRELRDLENKLAAQALIKETLSKKEAAKLKNIHNEENRMQDEIDLLQRECKLQRQQIDETIALKNQIKKDWSRAEGAINVFKIGKMAAEKLTKKKLDELWVENTRF